MATVYKFLPTPQQYYAILQERSDHAEAERHKRFMAILVLQRMTRGYLIRKHVAWLAENALTIQCAFRVHQARKAFRAALKDAVQRKHNKYYSDAAVKIQALWRGFASRKNKFCYRSYRKWLAIVTERGERRAAEAEEFRIRSRADDLKILEEEARKWLAFVVFKLHHLLRTASIAGVYSDPSSSELSEFEKLLVSIRYTDYMNRLRHKYNEFVQKYRPKFSNKRLFPVIGDGKDYWYLSLPEMYELTAPVEKVKNTRHLATHHGPQHQEPFLWKKVRPPRPDEGRGPFKVSHVPPPPPAPTPEGDEVTTMKKDPRFYLYVKYYKPQPDLFDYVEFHVNTLLKRRCSIQNINLQ